MAMNFVPQPATANIPTGAAGVPSTWSSPASASASVDLSSVFQAAIVQAADAQWGIYLNGVAVLTSGRVSAVELQAQYNVSDAPIENGAFMSYNKVKIPKQIMLEMLCDGSNAGIIGVTAISDIVAALTGGSSGALFVRGEFLAALDAMVADLNLYQVTTPEAVYQNMNVTGYNLRRATEKGITLIYADIMMQEIRIISSAVSTPTQQPQGAAQLNSGNVQSSAPTSAQLIQYQTPGIN